MLDPPLFPAARGIIMHGSVPFVKTLLYRARYQTFTSGTWRATARRFVRKSRLYRYELRVPFRAGMNTGCLLDALQEAFQIELGKTFAPRLASYVSQRTDGSPTPTTLDWYFGYKGPGKVRPRNRRRQLTGRIRVIKISFSEYENYSGQITGSRDTKEFVRVV